MRVRLERDHLEEGSDSKSRDAGGLGQDCDCERTEGRGERRDI